jgi:hypothetical protein
VIDTGARLPFDLAMADSPRLTPSKRIEQAERAERLADALRENLHRRKAQARAKQARAEEEPAVPRNDDPAA